MLELNVGEGVFQAVMHFVLPTVRNISIAIIIVIKLNKCDYKIEGRT